MLFLDDSTIFRDVFEEGHGAEEGVRCNDLANALLLLLSFGECEKQNRKHFIDLCMIVFTHIRYDIIVYGVSYDK